MSVAEPGRLAFLSGQIAGKPGSEDVPKDLPGQAKLATASLAAALEELEASTQDIVMLRVYVVNANTEAFQQVLPALRELLGDDSSDACDRGMVVRLASLEFPE